MRLLQLSLVFLPAFLTSCGTGDETIILECRGEQQEENFSALENYSASGEVVDAAPSKPPEPLEFRLMVDPLRNFVTVEQGGAPRALCSKCEVRVSESAITVGKDFGINRSTGAGVWDWGSGEAQFTCERASALKQKF